MNVFLRELSKEYPDDIILLVCDGAAWHKSKTLIVPENIRIFHIPPATPEMNPIEYKTVKNANPIKWTAVFVRGVGMKTCPHQYSYFAIIESCLL